MEAAVIVEGFCRSEEMYGIKYTKLIADGDSSVYKKILDAHPYKNKTVEKIECTNHLLRNFCNKLKEVVTTSDKNRNTVALRKKLGENILRFRTAAVKAIQYRRKEDRPLHEQVEELRKDILNSPSHIFGEHLACEERNYFCNSSRGETNFVPQLIEYGLYDKIVSVVRQLSNQSRSLIHNVNSNPVEHYNSVVAKFVGGKRINYSMRQSYVGRCAGAVVRHNTGMPHYKLHKLMYNQSPGIYCKTTELRRKRKVEHDKENRQSVKKPRRSLFKSGKKDKDYGQYAARPDMDNDTFARECDEFLTSLKLTEEERNNLERATVMQRDSGEWQERRRRLLTASHFGRVCNMLPYTSCESLVKTIMYSSADSKSMAYGRENEGKAKIALEKVIKMKIEDCGLFVDREIPYLGATPDGLIGEDGIVEVKCPSSVSDMTPEDAIAKKKVTAWIVDREGKILSLKKKHAYHLQVQGQLHVTGRQYCYLGLWTPLGIYVHKIDRDDEFWMYEMLPKLQKFYMNCLLPELVDPRHCRSMAIRNPDYILEEQKKRVVVKSTKNGVEMICQSTHSE